MARRLFIPGTGGCFFRDDAGNMVGSILDLAHDRQRDFVCEHDPDPDVLPPRRTTALRDAAGNPVEIQAAGPIRAVYTPFFDQVAPASTQKLYQFYNYDWRLDLRFNGERLWQFLRQADGAEPWDIACHSQAGLILFWASLLAEPALFRRCVRRVVCFGVPIQGTLNALDALSSGFSLAPGLTVDPATVRSWPSLYMMLPRWRLRIAGATGVEVFKASTWRRAGRLAAGSDLSAGISPQLLLRAQAWKAALDNQQFESLCGIDRLVLVQGSNLNTWARAPAFPRLPDLSRRDGASVVAGDSLVPADLTLRLLPPGLSAKVDSIITPVQSHILMCADQDQANLCERIFAD